jgi:hypothetical protein
MSDRSRNWIPAWVGSSAACLAVWLIGPAHAHTIDCSGRSGIELARCERHQKMATQCGPIKGDAHFACDREFLLANPLQCGALGDDDTKRCAAESAAFKACEPQPGREFMRCVGDRMKASPMGQP